MPVAELDFVAKGLRERLWQIREAPEDKSIHQVREEEILRTLSEVAQEARRTALAEEIFAVGKTPEEAIRALALALDWGEITKISNLEGGDARYTWGRRFLADGTSMKAAGWDVPGGVVLTWWK